jgi:hypothetical protein
MVFQLNQNLTMPGHTSTPQASQEYLIRGQSAQDDSRFRYVGPEYCMDYGRDSKF